MNHLEHDFFSIFVIKNRSFGLTVCPFVRFVYLIHFKPIWILLEFFQCFKWFQLFIKWLLFVRVNIKQNPYVWIIRVRYEKRILLWKQGFELFISNANPRSLKFCWYNIKRTFRCKNIVSKLYLLNNLKENLSWDIMLFCFEAFFVKVEVYYRMFRENLFYL